MSEYQGPGPNDKKSSTKSCLMIGCGVVLVFILAILTVFGFAGYKVHSFAMKYTDDKPVEVLNAEYSDQEIDKTEVKFKEINDKLEKGESVPSVMISEDELNMLVMAAAKGTPFAKSFAFDIEDGTVKTSVSIPLDEIPFMKGRYFNGDAEVELKFIAGYLQAHLTNLSVNGESVPSEVAKEMSKENLLKDLYHDPEAAPYLEKIKGFEVKGDNIKVILQKSETE